MITITFPDGQKRQYEEGSSALDIAKSISHGLAKKVISAKVNGEVWEATRPIRHDARLQLLTWDDKDGKMTFWHSSAHLMAEALEAIYPGIKFGTGPATDSGFYYDVDPGDHVISSDDFPRIEQKMIELARQKNEYVRKPISLDDAVAFFKEKGDEYKLELLEKRKEEAADITLYEQGNFIDLCRGPHVPDTSYIKAVKLTNVAGAYWQGDESRQQMTRVYGITFPKQSELDEYVQMIEEAKRRDHRKLGAELELFMFSERVGAGLPIWLPKGNQLRDRLMNFLRQEQEKRGYKLVTTPHIGKKDLYVTSGHWEKYGEDIPVRYHPEIRSVEGCYRSSSLAVELARRHNTRLHILHISTARELDLFRNDIPLEQKRITSEVCVHHLYFNSKDYETLGTQIKCNPAIKSAEHQAALFPALLDNRLDIIATDHAPHTWEEKQGTYFQAPSGVPLVQHSLNVMLEFYHQGRISLERIVEKMCHAPAVCFRVEKRGFVEEGYWADLALVDVDKQWQAGKDNIYFKCGWSPFEGHTFRGKVASTIVSGHLAYHEGRFDEGKKGERLGFLA